MNEKTIKILESLFWIIITAILAICDFAKSEVMYTIFGCIFAVLSVCWCYILAKHIDNYKE